MPDQQLKYKVYKDLWERQYYITSGEKFGGDFLVYPGKISLFLYIATILTANFGYVFYIINLSIRR